LSDEDEVALRKMLKALPKMDADQAANELQELERIHAPRRNWVWAKPGQSPIAEMIGPLARLALATRSAIGGATPDDIRAVYVEKGWQADAIAFESLSLVRGDTAKMIGEIVCLLLKPWLEDLARAFQASLDHGEVPSVPDNPVLRLRRESVLSSWAAFAMNLGSDLPTF